jgi:hypothetical protein
MSVNGVDPGGGGGGGGGSVSNVSSGDSSFYSPLFGTHLAMPEWEALITIFSLTVVIVVTIVGNILVIISVFTHAPLKERNRRRCIIKTNKLNFDWEIGNLFLKCYILQISRVLLKWRCPHGLDNAQLLHRVPGCRGPHRVYLRPPAQRYLLCCRPLDVWQRPLQDVADFGRPLLHLIDT